jgi:serine palmitoyltransferase
VPADTVVLKDRVTNDYGWTFEFTGIETRCINMASYNYLGFAQNKGPCADESIKALEKFGIAICSPRSELGEREIQNN